MTTTNHTPGAYGSRLDARLCARCGHRSDQHRAGPTEACVEGYCECRWFMVLPVIRLQLTVQMRTGKHAAVQTSEGITCECGVMTRTRDELARRHQHSPRVMPSVFVTDLPEGDCEA